MPERPKRRKNNKNKRKNKNNRPDANKSNSDVKTLDNSESCHSQNDNENDFAESEGVQTNKIQVINEEISQPSTIDIQNTASTSDVVNLNGDLNNNRNQVVNDQLLTIPVEKVQDPDTTDTDTYVVECPEQSIQSKAKLKSKLKSKSLDDDEATKIIEITEDIIAQSEDDNALALIDSQNVVVTHVESDIEWEKTTDLNDNDVAQSQEVATGTLSVTTIPLSIAQCEQTKSLTPDEEKSLRIYLNSLNLATQPENLNAVEVKTEIEQIINQEIKQRLRKKGLADDFFMPRLGPTRILDVIDEEGSSESSMTSRRQSYLSDRKSDIEDLDDDVFEEKNKLTKQKKMMTCVVHKKSLGQLVPQECVLVGAKIKEPEVSEARGDWTMKTMEKMTGAEVVYLTDTSSSTSSLHEIEDENDGVDTDVSVRMITPTIEVTDTENFLKKTFISNEDEKHNNLNANQQIKQNDTIEIIEKEKASEKNDQELTNKYDNTEHFIKVEIEQHGHNNNEHTSLMLTNTDKPVENVHKHELKENYQHAVHNKTSTNERTVEISCEQDLKDNNPLPNINTTANERIINIEFHDNPNEIKYDTENVSTNTHEIVVLSTDNIKTNLYVKDIDEAQNKDTNKLETKSNEFDLKSKLIKCEFNDAINNLIKEVSSESEENNENLKDTFSRQDSSSSVDSSQCTAKYNPNYSSLNDIANMTHDENGVNNKSNPNQLSSSASASHVKDVFECVTGATAQSQAKTDDDTKEPSKLRDLCVRNIASLPYGKKILEELASVSERLQNIALFGTASNTTSKYQEKLENMPHYRLPDVSSIETITIPTKTKDPIPPPIKPRHSSLKKSSQDDEHWTGVPTKTEPVYVCLSPSQKMLMEKTNTVITKDEASHLVDMHRKFVDRRGYNEHYKNEKDRIENEFDNSPVIPFKSQTGSRLLALIRDPTLTSNINSLNQRLNSSSDELHRKHTTTFSKMNHERFVNRDFSFKPIPPPRPKKYSSSFYESDESSDFTDNSMRSIKSEKKFFHYSTGNLNKEIESDISSIQNMHRYFTDTRDDLSDFRRPRRPSLPKDLCEQQMEYIRKKEKEVEAEIQRLESLKNNRSQAQRQGPRAPLVSEKEVINEKIKDSNNYFISRKKDVAMSSQGSDNKKSKMSSLFSSSQEELLRDKMYSEYVSQMAEREERKQHKVIKITNVPATTNNFTVSKSMPLLDVLDSKVNNRIEKEFISKARERWDKLGIKDPETEDERESTKNVYKEPKVIEHKIKVIDGGQEKDVKKLPSHLQEFVQFTAKDTEQGASSSAIWRPGAPPPVAGSAARSPGAPPPPPPPPVWTPGSAGASPQTPRKTFRPVHFEETPPTRRKFVNSEQNGCTSGSESEGRLRTSHSAPVTGLSTLGGSHVASRLPKAQNPTVTLLQKAREGQIPRGPSYIQQERDAARLPRDRPSPPRGDPVHALRKEYASEGEADRSDYERGGVRKMADAQRKVEGIGPITKDGMPVALRSEVKDPSRWYKKMYDTIHKNKYDDDYVTIRYKSRRGQPPERVSSNKSQYAYFDPRSGYLSEPEGGLSRLGMSTWSDAYDSDVTTGPRRRTASVQEDRRFNDVNSPYMPSTNKYSTLASARASQEVYKNQPGRIENYVPGKSSVVDKEAKQWWDEVMDIFDGQNISSTTSLPQSSPKDKKDLTTTILSKSNMARALKESGYESDSTLVFRRREDTEAPLSPAERRAAYRDLQAGGEPPLRGFRSPAPPRQDESEIEYIPISSTLTKIRVHKKTPKVHEVICYPITRIETGEQVKFKRFAPSFLSIDVPSIVTGYPPAPPRRISSKNSRTLKLVTSTRPVSTSPRRSTTSTQSNVDFLKDKINHKLCRQNTHIISKSGSTSDKKSVAVDSKLPKTRIMSTSAPPAINRKYNPTITTKTSMKTLGNESRTIGTSSFGSSRRTLLPTEYSNSVHSKYGEPHSSVVIEGGAGRKTPISNILDKVTSLDKLWSAEKRNERIDLTKMRSKSLSKDASNTTNKTNINKPSSISSTKSLSPTSTHKSRDMIRTAEKVQKLKISKLYTKSNPCLTTKNEQKITKTSTLQSTSNISKSSSNITTGLKKPNQVKTAVVTNLKKKKSLESVIIRPRSVPCHESCSKKAKDSAKNIKKTPKTKNIKKSNVKPSEESESGSQFGDTSNETSNFGSFENLGARRISSKEIKKSHDAIVSDSFFQHLFLGRASTPSLVYPMLEPNTTVLQKAKMFQSLPQDNISPKSLNTYLIHRKPVSLSHFKMWDRYPSPSRAQSPRSVSWPGRMHDEIRKFDSLSKYDEFGSTSSLATVRSRSEPPCNKMYFSQTSRPKSPTIVFHKKDKPKESPIRSAISPSRLIFTQSRRSISPKVIHKVDSSPSQVKRKSLSPSKIVFTETIRPVSPVVTKQSPRLETIDSKADKYPSTIFFSQTSRPVSPKVIRKSTVASISRSHSTSPVSIRSPSCRRIHSARLQNSKHYADTVPKSVFRTRSAGDAERKILIDSFPMKTKSDTNLHSGDPDYDEYIRDMQNTKMRSERFRELNRYYTYLERVAELEKATSTSDLRHRRKDEEIIDFDRWKKIRAIERAEEELNNLYRKLKLAQTEKDVLFYPRDLKDFRWNHDTDRGLRIKERSVEDLKDHFQQIPHYDSMDLDQPQSRDSYKPLWRGTSVAETAFYINKKNDSDNLEHRATVKPTVTLQQDSSLNDLRKKIGLGSRLWSSLSMDQVNALKNQLNAIYSKELESKTNKESDKYSIDVKPDKLEPNPSLHVRCNSLITSDYNPEREKPAKLAKSDSIAAISCPITSVKDLKNNVNKIQMTLSENEKRKISQTLSKEILNRISKFDTQAPLSLKEEIENTEIKDQLLTETKDIVVHKSSDFIRQEITHNIENDQKRHVVYTNEKTETPCQSSASETETASSDISNKTVIYKGPSKEVQKKVQYFESVKNVADQTKTVYHARENSDEKENQDQNNSDTAVAIKETKANVSGTKPSEPQKNQIVQSQSCANFKELFGETEKHKFLSLPSKPDLHSRSASPYSELYIADRRTPDTLRCSSDETIWRSRSPSPDPERYWRAYLNLARAGEVRRLARRFDSPTAAGAVLRRYRSDPELSRNAFISSWSSFEKLSSRRDKCRVVLPVARVPLRPTNRYMPHIDIISKLASLRRRTAPRSRSAEEALECRPGEVDRIRRRFETMSLLGQIYASAPDVSELHDMAPYLAGSWIAHRYPKRSDNNRSLEDPNILVRGRTSPVKKEIKKISPKESIKLSSILKSDTFAKQEFNPAAHRPASRYEPPRAPPRPPPASWPYRLSPYVTPSRHTVTFQETDSAPEPPRRTSHGSYSDTESPRRYVESDVNIHYRCPVRHDPLPLVPERELARQQAEHMKRLYREQKRNKYLQELQDMQNRRHQDNFTPSQKNILPLNRYDEADKVIAKALYTFNGQTPRELSFRKGEMIHVRRQIDNNWYEGELHGRIGLFPYNYVEIQKGDVVQTPKKSVIVEGRARAKFDFTAQTNLELPLKKGEVVVLTRRIDQNWWEGRNGTKTGIFPDSYVTVLQEPSQSKPDSQSILNSDKPVASPAAHGLLNGSAKRSMGSHSYTPQPNSPALSNAPPATQPLPGYVAKPAQATLTPSERGYGPPSAPGVDLNNTEPLYVDTNAEAIPYRAMYKYRPQNPDELELNEGDTVYVLEKCDDGWYVGSSQRTGRFGTFPGNYVERI